MSKFLYLSNSKFLSLTRPKLRSNLLRPELGGDEKRSGYVQYVSVISANVPCTYYVHRPVQSVFGMCTYLGLFSLFGTCTYIEQTSNS